MSRVDYPAAPYDAELQPALEELLRSFSPALHPEDIQILRGAKLNPDQVGITAAHGRALRLHPSRAVSVPGDPRRHRAG
jgi:hypothetical protein